MPYARVTLGLLSILAVFSGCRGCAGGAATGRPTQFIHKDAQGLLEIRDLGRLAQSKPSLTKTLSGLMTEQQLDDLEHQLALVIGFDPATENGLEEAGLPKAGAIAGELEAEGRGALWVVPVRDAARFEKVIDRIAHMRTTVETSDKIKIGAQEVTVLGTSFGPDKISVAAYTFTRGFALIGAGPKAKDLIARALDVADPAKGGQDILKNPEYVALDRALGSKADVRLFVPAVAATGKAALEAMSKAGVPGVDRLLDQAPDLKGLKGAGFTLTFVDRAVELGGLIRLDDQALARAKRIFGPSTNAPKGVRALDSKDAFLFGWLSADVKAAIAELAPEGSPLRADLDKELDRGKRELDLDLEKEMLPLLSGQGAFAMGLGNLAGAEVSALLDSPARYIWTLVALGANEPPKLAAIAKRADKKLEARGFEISERKAKDAEVLVVSRSTDGGTAAKEVLVESAAIDGALLLSNDSAATDRALAAIPAIPAGADDKARSIPLDGKPGMVLELRMASLTQKLDTLNLFSLPILYRTIAAKIVQTLHALERFSIALRPADDGLAVSARLELSPPGSPNK